MRVAVALAALLFAGCAAPGHAPTNAQAEAAPHAPAPGRLLNCTVEQRFLAPEGFVKGRARLDRTAWLWGLNPVPAAQDTVPTRLKVPLLDPVPAGWSALAVALQVRTHSGTVAAAPVAESPIVLVDPATYVGFPSPMPPGYQDGARTIDLALGGRDASAKALSGTLAFDSTFLSTGRDGVDLALVSDPGARDAHGHERLTRLDAFYCGGERLSLQDFLGYDFDTGTYDR